MQTIETRYIGPTNTRGSRIKAKASGGESVTIPLDYGMTTYHAHAKAADALRVKLGWDAMFMAEAKGTGYVFAFPPEPQASWIGRE